MQFTAEQIANLTSGIIEGNSNVAVNNIAKIEEAKAGDLTFLSNKKYLNFIYNTNASIVLVNNNFTFKEKIDATLIKVENAQLALNKLLNFVNESLLQQVDSSYFTNVNAFIHPSATIAENVKIAHNCYIGANVKIGRNTKVYPNVSIYHNCEIGENCIIHSGTVIGSDGFGFLPTEDGSYNKVPQLGNVKIGNAVEIGSNCSIDRATMGSTIIEDGVKLDNLIQVAHNVRIKKNTVIAAQTGIAGSSKIGANCMIGGQVGIVGHIEIADGTRIQAQSGVAATVKKENTAINGTPAFDYRKVLKSQLIFRNLPDLLKRIEELEKEIQKLKFERNA